MIGLDETHFSLHSLRRGGANHALSAGICGEDIRLMGDWASLAYLEYIDLTMERRVTNMVRFVEAVDEKVLRAEMEEWEVGENEILGLDDDNALF